jgi:membrane protein YqaA with SNARE-associated domain
LLAAINQSDQHVLLWLAASVGNTLGGLTSWWLGNYAFQWRHKKHFPLSTKRLRQGISFYRRFGFITLLFSWLPIIGDAFPMVAGLCRFNVYKTAVLLFIGKSLRYAFVIWIFI